MSTMLPLTLTAFGCCAFHSCSILICSSTTLLSPPPPPPLPLNLDGTACFVGESALETACGTLYGLGGCWDSCDAAAEAEPFLLGEHAERTLLAFGVLPNDVESANDSSPSSTSLIG